MEVEVDIGSRIREMRKASGLTQEEVARATDISLTAYSQLERGVTRDPHYSTLRQIAHALGVPVEVLIKEEADQVPLGAAPAA
jgi:transcriptional regulator with XRE-family HTH domain